MSWYKPWTWGDESASATQKRDDLNNQGGMSSWFADQGQQGYQQMGAEASQARDYLRGLASGQNSVSAEQLRQGLGQNMAAQRSMAASASPQNAAMAARTAAIQTGRLGAGMSGQAALAGLQERQAAQKQLNDSILQARQQDQQVALGSRQNAISGYGGTTPEGSTLDKWANPVAGGLGAAAKFSDKRLKEDIEDGDDDANETMRGLRSYTFKYKDKKLGKDRELGVMAQDLERSGLKHTVIETPKGKAVHGAALATANTAMLSALERRVSKIEGGKK
jgi:hypothetical protein